MTRNLVKSFLTWALLSLAFVASGAALAQRHGGHGHFHHGDRVHFGFYLGVPIYGSPYYPPYYAPYYPPPYYYYSQATGVSHAPSVYIEQGHTLPAPAQAQGEYYCCAASNGYYPYVSECPAGWRRVPVHSALMWKLAFEEGLAP